VLFLVVDTLRADRLSLYGYGRPTSPNLEAVLLRWMKSREGSAGSRLSRRRAAELEKKLRAVGYL